MGAVDTDELGCAPVTRVAAGDHNVSVVVIRREDRMNPLMTRQGILLPTLPELVE
jgi:hypothetical protein